jgi:hypothetical protein
VPKAQNVKEVIEKNGLSFFCFTNEGSTRPGDLWLGNVFNGTFFVYSASTTHSIKNTLEKNGLSFFCFANEGSTRPGDPWLGNVLNG